MSNAPVPLSSRCRGWPEGHDCPVRVVGSMWCEDCRRRRQEALARGVLGGSLNPVGIVLTDIEAPVLACQCGGDATSPNHAQSLAHVEWEWRRSPQGTPHRGILFEGEEGTGVEQ